MDSLTKLSFFARLPKDTLDWLEPLMPVRRYVSRQLLFMEGEPSDFMGFVLEGRVKLYRVSSEGQEKVVHIATAGDVFGELPYFDGKPHPLTAETMEETRVRLISHQDLDRLWQAHPDIGREFLRVASLRLRQTYRQIRSLTFKDAYARTAGRLYKLARDYGVKTAQGVELSLTFTQQELANLIGTSRETMSKILNSLQKNRILTANRGQIIILDMDKLRKHS
ncbi:MAG: Crp/Fnr family transcriptional regulator [Bacillota bacterium]